MENGKSKWTQDSMGGRERRAVEKAEAGADSAGPGVKRRRAQLCDWLQPAPVRVSFLSFSPRKGPVTVPTPERCCKDETKRSDRAGTYLGVRTPLERDASSWTPRLQFPAGPGTCTAVPALGVTCLLPPLIKIPWISASPRYVPVM